jgi:hypothetical protein
MKISYFPLFALLCVAVAVPMPASAAPASASAAPVPDSLVSTLVLVGLLAAALVAIVALIIALIQKKKINDLTERLEEMDDDFNSRLQKVHESLPTEALSRNDVLLLLKEELDRKSAERAAAEAKAKADAGAADDSEKHPKVFFFGRPTAELMFDDNRKTLEHFESSYYRFTLDSHEPDQATIDFVPSRQGAIKALDGRERTIEPVCNLTVKGDKPVSFRQTAAGRAVLKNGFWTVIKKIEVVYE